MLFENSVSKRGSVIDSSVISQFTDFHSPIHSFIYQQFIWHLARHLGPGLSEASPSRVLSTCRWKWSHPGRYSLVLALGAFSVLPWWWVCGFHRASHFCDPDGGQWCIDWCWCRATSHIRAPLSSLLQDVSCRTETLMCQHGKKGKQIFTFAIKLPSITPRRGATELISEL